jgi:hypothetical protein
VALGHPPTAAGKGVTLEIVYEIVYEVNNHLFVRFLKGNALSKQSSVFTFPKLFASSKQSHVHAFVKTNAPEGNALNRYQMLPKR